MPEQLHGYPQTRVCTCCDHPLDDAARSAPRSRWLQMASCVKGCLHPADLLEKCHSHCLAESRSIWCIRPTRLWVPHRPVVPAPRSRNLSLLEDALGIVHARYCPPEATVTHFDEFTAGGRILGKEFKSRTGKNFALCA